MRVSDQREMVAGDPFFEHERSGADHDLVERVRSAVATRDVDRDFVGREVAGIGPDLLQQVVREDAVGARSQREVGRVHRMEVNDDGVLVRRIDTLNLVPATDGNDRRRVLVAELQEPEVKRRLDVLGRKGDAIMPLDAVAKLPGHIHLVASDFDIAVFQGGHFGGQLGHPVVRQFGIRRNVLVRLHRQQTLHRRVDVGAGMRRGGRDVAAEQAVLLLPGGDRQPPSELVGCPVVPAGGRARR